MTPQLMPNLSQQLQQQVQKKTTQTKITPTQTTQFISDTKAVVPNATVHSDIQAQKLKNVTTKGVNPLFFKDSTDRQAASLAKIQRIMKNPHYQKLNPEQQEKLRSTYFDRYVAPQYNPKTFPVDKATWVKGVSQTKFGPEAYYETESTQLVNRLSLSAEHEVGQILHGTLTAGVWMGQQASLAQLGLNHFFEHAITSESVSNKKVADDKESLDRSVNYAQKVVDRISNNYILDSNFWLQTHPSKTLAEKASSFIGEQIVQLPLYEGVGLLRAAGNVGKVANLTEWLGKTPVGKIAATTLGNAADAFMGSVLQGQSKEDTESNVAWFAGLGAAGKTLSLASSAVMKKFIANTVAMGGKPLAQALTNQAEHELTTGIHTATEADPIKAKTVTTYKAIVNSIAQSNFQKPFKELSTVEKSKVRQFHSELTQDAIREMPLHVPELAKANIKEGIEQNQKLDPEMAAWDKVMTQKYGIDFAETLHGAEQETISKQTGVKSSQGATKKVSRSTAKINAAITESVAKASKEEPRKFAQMKVDHLAYFKNPVNAKTGQRFDYRTWLDGMDSKDFLSELKEHVGNDWFFENPQHLLEYALTYRKEMPAVFGSRIVEELEQIDPTGDPTQWYASAKKRDKHLENMATTGRLYNEKNIFRSSKFNQGTRATKWQTQLNKEAEVIKKNEKLELASRMASIKKHYPDIDQLTQTILLNLQDALK